MNALMEQTLTAGDAASSDYERNRFWEAVRAIGKTLPNSPLKKGRGRNIKKNSNLKKAINETKLDASKIVNSKLVADLYRHRFTNLVKAKNDDTWWPSSGSISRVLKPMSLAEASNSDGEGGEHDAAHYMMSKTLFEANYVKVQNSEQEDFDLFDEYEGSFKLIGTQEGYFAPKNSTWAVLFDRRSWTQLCQDYSKKITESDICLLESGHRLIRQDVAKKIGLTQLNEIEFLNRYPLSPVSFLMAHFQEEKQNSFFDTFDSEEYHSDWLNIGELELGDSQRDVYLRSSALKKKRELQDNNAWTAKELHTELIVAVSEKEEWYFSLERLIPKNPGDDPMGQMAEYYPHIYRLHITKDYFDLQTSSDNIETRIVTIFDEESRIIPEAFREYYGNLNKSGKTQFTFEHLYDVVRSLFSAGGTVDSLESPGWSCPHYIRQWMGPLSDDVPVLRTIEKLDEKLAEFVEEYIRKRMWLD